MDASGNGPINKQKYPPINKYKTSLMAYNMYPDACITVVRCVLIHKPLTVMAISMIITQNFSLGIRCEIALRWMPQKSILVQVMAWCCLYVNATESCWWEFNTVSGKSLVLSGDPDLYRHVASPGYKQLTHWGRDKRTVICIGYLHINLLEWKLYILIPISPKFSLWVQWSLSRHWFR